MLFRAKTASVVVRKPFGGALARSIDGSIGMHAFVRAASASVARLTKAIIVSR